MILHVDMDSFYASVEARDHPEHKGKPVIIGADPQGGQGRGVVAACSYEARKFGVHSALPISRAFRLCPDGVYLRPNFEKYDLVSEQIMDYLRTLTEQVEPVSIDEAYIEATDIVGDYDSPVELAKKIQSGVYEKFELTCSIGIAHNRSIAKIASDHNKPNGITNVPFSQYRSFLAPLPISRVSGIGPKTEQVLNDLGIFTVEELAAATKQELSEALGKYGFWLWDIANGLENEEVLGGEHQRSSISHEHTFHKDTSDFNLIEERIKGMSRDLWERIRDHNQHIKTVTLKIRFEDFTTVTRSKSLIAHTASLRQISSASLELLKEFKTDKKMVRLIGLRLSNIKELDERQSTLLSYQ